MNIEVRDNSVVISGYVNAVERLSKPITCNLHGKKRTFLEKIKAGVFKKALKKNDDVLVLLNHDKERAIARTSDGSAVLDEDNIGLRAEITITDDEVVQKAREGKLSGWSFGFMANDDELTEEGSNEVRTLKDIDLVEVSILDDKHSPAYYGTSIEARDSEHKMLEVRADMFKEIEQMASDKHEEVYKEAELKHKEIDKEKEDAKMNALAELIAEKIMQKLGEQREQRESIDYSQFESRIKLLKK